MPDKAQVTSIEALEAFRTSLILYLSKARPTVEEVSADVLRVKLWLQNDQRMHWEGQVRRRMRELEQAQQALFSGRVSTLRHETSAEQLAVQKARHALEEAEGKLRKLKAWNREFDSRVEPLVKHLEKLHSVLSIDMLKATNLLAQIVSTLQDYADLTPSLNTPAVEGQNSEAGRGTQPAAAPGSPPAAKPNSTPGENQ